MIRPGALEAAAPDPAPHRRRMQQVSGVFRPLAKDRTHFLLTASTTTSTGTPPSLAARPRHFYRRLPAVDVSCRIDQKIDNRTRPPSASILIVSSTPPTDGSAATCFQRARTFYKDCYTSNFPRYDVSPSAINELRLQFNSALPSLASWTSPCQPIRANRSVDGGFAIHESSQSHLLPGGHVLLYARRTPSNSGAT